MVQIYLLMSLGKLLTYPHCYPMFLEDVWWVSPVFQDGKTSVEHVLIRD